MILNIIELTNYLLLSTYINYIGIIVYIPQRKLTKKKIISMLITSILLFLINTYFQSIYTIFLIFILFIIYYQLNYPQNIKLSLSSALIVVSFLFIINIAVNSILSISILNNLIELIISFLLTILFRNKIKFLVQNTKNIILTTYLVLSVCLIALLSKSTVQEQLIQNAIIFIILITLLTLTIIKSQELEQIEKENKELQKYIKTIEQSIIDYRKIEHEHKNKLIIIKNLVKENEKELKEYLDYLINEPISIKSKYLTQLKYIPITMIKNFINYKINVLEKYRAKIELFVGEELQMINPEKVSVVEINNINTIIGIILDNMIDSIVKTKEKLVSINIYIDKNTIHILLANNIENRIDLNKISKIGYSTKGTTRGVGLSLVNDIIKSSKKLELETRIEDNFFIQHLKIKNINKYLK